MSGICQRLFLSPPPPSLPLSLSSYQSASPLKQRLVSAEQSSNPLHVRMCLCAQMCLCMLVCRFPREARKDKKGFFAPRLSCRVTGKAQIRITDLTLVNNPVNTAESISTLVADLSFRCFGVGQTHGCVFILCTTGETLISFKIYPCLSIFYRLHRVFHDFK